MCKKSDTEAAYNKYIKKDCYVKECLSEKDSKIVRVLYFMVGKVPPRMKKAKKALKELDKLRSEYLSISLNEPRSVPYELAMIGNKLFNPR